MPTKNFSFKSLARQWADALLAPFPFASIHRWPRYISDWKAFQAMPGGKGLRFRDAYPCLRDAVAKTPFDPHYFHQSAWLARRLGEVRPSEHVDVGSSVGTVSILAGFMPVTFVDIRPLAASLSNLTCITGTVLDLPFKGRSVNSLSCLHVIEHIGLGRYGDPLDPTGSAKAARELSRVLALGGRLYLSTPIGRERVCFNAHRVFAPETIIAMFGELALLRFAWIDDRGDLHSSAAPSDAANADYGCGLFEFSRTA